jgi:hypothetical protein
MAINGNTYSHENIQIIVANKTAAVVDIEYDEEGESSEVHILGQRAPYAVINGKSRFPVKLTLLVDEYDALQDSLPPGASLRSMAAVNIQVARLDRLNRLRTDRIVKFKVTKINKKYTAGEPHATIDIEGNAGDIEYNI